ncbi:uncharacterized protein LOC129588830 [Paramacrobiotus metropolitanus]|uniref:uncharacterized protein LOC129588830 n=1 Tax=Paramacrobiotus metropolitanus TaxID=2943436 RepID=UPI002445DE99|nr:uncharacterized protein LOC129588830 [Paramacrobiotus metropolitanus]
MSACRKRAMAKVFVCSARSWCLLLQLQFCAVLAASPQRVPSVNSSDSIHRKAGRSHPDLNDIFAEAMLNSRQEDRIILPQLAPSQDVMDSLVYRPRLGEDAIFRCIVPADIDWREVVWLHQDRPVFQAGRPLLLEDTTGQAYNFSRENRTLILQIYNVTMGSGGSVQCVVAPPARADSPRRVLQRYMLLPLITHHRDVFFYEEHDTSFVNAAVGDRVTLGCTIRLPLPPGIYNNLHNHLIWRQNGRIIIGPQDAPYGSLMPSTRPIHSTLHTPPPNRPGQLASCIFNSRS